MKKTKALIIIILLAQLAIVFLMVACAENEASPTRYTVKLYDNAKLVVQFEVEAGGVIAPYMTERQKMFPWHTSRTGNIEWNIYKDTVNCDLSLYYNH